MADSRSSDERDQEDLDVLATANMVRVRGPSSPGGIFLPMQLRELEEVSPNWSLHPGPTREPHSVEDKSLPGQGNAFCEDFQWE